MDLPSDLHPNGRFNDGKCDALGRFWVGTMDKNVTEPIGAVYRFDLQLKPTQMDKGFTISNGISWSPDNKTMYFADSPARIIYAYDFDLAQGNIANRRVFASFDETPGRPDGCTVDSEGFIWSARVRGGRALEARRHVEQEHGGPPAAQEPEGLSLAHPDEGQPHQAAPRPNFRIRVPGTERERLS
jgi:sugar lactone lactonase YvrE